MELLVFGLNHRTAPVEIRERWAFSRDRSLQALGRLQGILTPSEHLILSTCNRTEFYSHVPRASSPVGDAEDPREQCRSLANFYLDDDSVTDEDLGYFYFHRQQAAVEHLFRVAGGLDSMIVGESEILRQIKDAWEVARGSNAAGKMFQRLFPEALKVGKRVRTATNITKGCITPGQAALQLADEVLGDSNPRGLRGARALLIGSGKVATSTARSLLDRGLRDFTIVNRTPEHAHHLLAEMRGRLDDDSGDVGKTARWEDLAEEAAHVDVIISSTASKHPVLSRDAIARVQETRGGAPLAIIDLAIPRDVDPEASEIDGVHLFNIDALNRVVHENVRKRHEHVEHAERIVREQLSVFFGRLKFLEIEPVIRHLIERFEDIRLGEMQSSLDKFPPELHGAVDEMTKRLVSKMIHFPIERLKAVRDMEGIGEAEIQFLRRLYLSDR
jgi:glutamyl-tRNA reductase